MMVWVYDPNIKDTCKNVAHWLKMLNLFAKLKELLLISK